MPRVYVPHSVGPSESITVKGETARYLNSVLRLKRGDTLSIYDNEGEHFDARVASASRGSMELDIAARLPKPQEPPGGVVLAMGMLKGQKNDLVVQKAVELGVNAIVPLVTRRTVLKETRKLERWQKIAHEAARQCGRPGIPTINSPQQLVVFLDAKKISGVVFYEEKGPQPLMPEDVTPGPDGLFYLAVGPEGGFEPEEIGMLKEAGFRVRTLGNNILRAETASIATVAIVQYLMGRLR